MGPRDVQKAKCYRFDTQLQSFIYQKMKADDSTYKRASLSLEECSLLAHMCLAHMGMEIDKPLKIKDGRGTRTARGGAWHLNLPLWARHPELVIHEIAHTVMARCWGLSKHQAHGPEYVRVLIHLCAKMYKLNESELVSVAKTKYNLKVAPSTFIKETKAKVKLKNI